MNYVFQHVFTVVACILLSISKKLSIHEKVKVRIVFQIKFLLFAYFIFGKKEAIEFLSEFHTG